MAQIASLHTYAAWIFQYRQNAFCVQEHSPANCTMSRLVNVQSSSVLSGYSARSTISRSVSTKGAVACPTAHHSTIRKTLSSSVETLRASCGQGRILSSDRSMPFKRSSLLWLAGAFVISAVAAQNAHGKVSSVIGHAMSHLARPIWHVLTSLHTLQGLPTAEASLSLELSEQTATQSTGPMPTKRPVNISVHYPQKGEQNMLHADCQLHLQGLTLHFGLASSPALPVFTQSLLRHSEHDLTLIVVICSGLVFAG